MPNLDHTPDPANREARLRDSLIAWLGSVRPNGRPHLVPVWFYWDGETALVLSQPNTQKERNLEREPRVSLALDDTRIGRDVVLLEGDATLVSSGDDALTGAVASYLVKYAGLLAEMQYAPDEYIADYSQAILIRSVRFVQW